jgi:hypothetical protein
VLWLESEELPDSTFEGLVDQVAEIVRPFPVVGFNPGTNTVVAVNDQYFQHQAFAGNSESGGSSNHNTSSTSSSGQQTASWSGITQSTSNSSSSSGRGGGSSDDPPPPPPPPPNAGVWDPATPPDASRTSEIGPFEGVFTIEDPCGHQQSVGMTFCLRIESTNTSGRIFTTTTFTNFCLSLFSPDDPQQSTSKDPLSPYFVCNEVCLWIGPDSTEMKKCKPLYKTPNRRWDVVSASQSSERTVGLTSTLTFPPSIQFGLSKKRVGGVELDPSSRYIDFERARFRQIWPTREHFWKYPLRRDRVKDDDLELPTHTSKVTYTNEDDIRAIHTRVTAMHMVDSNSRTANRLTRRHAEERERRRALSKPFRFKGNSKHLILQFTAMVKKQRGKSIQFDGSGVVLELYHKVNGNSGGAQEIENGAEQWSRNSSQLGEVGQAVGDLSIRWEK